MIYSEDVFKIGKLIKPHGLKGEIVFEFDNDVFDKVDCPYLVCLMDGIFVPFFIKEYRYKNDDQALVTFEDIDNDEKAKLMSGVEIYFPRKFYDEELEEDLNYSLDFFKGFEVTDIKKGYIGQIVDIDDATLNCLFLLKDSQDNDIIIPATEDFIVDIDSENKKLTVDLPLGLLD